MAFLDDVIDLVTGQISHIGLSLDGSTEVSGGGYSHRVPNYASASGQTANLTAPLEFDGPANAGPVTHLIFKRAGSPWVIRPLPDQSKSYNSDGRIYLVSAPVTSDFLS